ANNGYDQPAAERYFDWLGRFVVGDWRTSRVYNEPVARVVGKGLANTAILALGFFVLLIPLSLGLGVLAGMREGSRLDRVVSTVCVVSASIPTFASTVFLSALFVFQLHWLPGTSSMIDGFSFKELILPVLVLVLYDFGYVARITRASMVEVMTAPYVRTAVLKGLPYRRVVVRPAVGKPVITTVAVLLLHVNLRISGVPL